MYHQITSNKRKSIIVVVGFYLVSLGLSTYLDPRSRIVRLQVKGT